MKETGGRTAGPPPASHSRRNGAGLVKETGDDRVIFGVWPTTTVRRNGAGLVKETGAAASAEGVGISPMPQWSRSREGDRSGHGVDLVRGEPVRAAMEPVS